MLQRVACVLLRASRALLRAAGVLLRSGTVAARVAAAGTVLTLGLVLGTGALNSPLLFLLPFPILLFLAEVRRRSALTLLLGTAFVLLLGEAVREAVQTQELTQLGASLLAGALVVALIGRQRRQATGRPRASVAQSEPALPQLPASSGEATVRAALQELERQLALVREWSGAEAVVLWEAREGELRSLAAAGRTLPGDPAGAGELLRWVAREGTPLWLEPTPLWSEPGRQVAAARVGCDGDVAWVITGEFATAERPRFEALTAWCGPLRLVLYVLSEQSRAIIDRERLARLVELLRSIPVALELERFGQELLHAAMQLTGATGGALASWDGNEGEVVAVAGHDGGPAPLAHFTSPHSELALAARAADVIVREAGQWRAADTPVANLKDEWLARPRALVSMPLAATPGQSQVVGALAIWSTRAPRFEPETLELLRAVLPYAALHLVHAREYGRLQQRADRDALTGLRNRRAFEAAFEAERARFERYGRSLALLMIDLDHFKSINDQYGHQAGDEVLRSAARVIESAVRDVDIPARYGGEEFVVLLPETSLRAAAEAAERVRAAVERASIYSAGRLIPVRVSIGVSACPEVVARPAELVGSADAALYRAKAGGRNVVCV